MKIFRKICCFFDCHDLETVHKEMVPATFNRDGHIRHNYNRETFKKYGYEEMAMGYLWRCKHCGVESAQIQSQDLDFIFDVNVDALKCRFNIKDKS